MVRKVNLAGAFATFSDTWSPRIAGQVDGYDIKLVRLEGDFVWHKHDDADELFLVIEGQMEIAFRDHTVTLDAGEFLVVPRGVEHKPHAQAECKVMLFERQGLVNTGDAPVSDLTQRAQTRI
ncbi:MAG: cupin domain-containing protein [Rhodobacterales bacterium]|nr:cupin domain-containing protein [Rhodobacterales bacterium]